MQEHLHMSLLLICSFKNIYLGTSTVAQWLRLWIPNAGGPGLIPGQGTRSHMLQLRLKIEAPNKKTKQNWVSEILALTRSKPGSSTQQPHSGCHSLQHICAVPVMSPVPLGQGLWHVVSASQGAWTPQGFIKYLPGLALWPPCRVFRSEDQLRNRDTMHSGTEPYPWSKGRQSRWGWSRLLSEMHGHTLLYLKCTPTLCKLHLRSRQGQL